MDRIQDSLWNKSSVLLDKIYFRTRLNQFECSKNMKTVYPNEKKLLAIHHLKKTPSAESFSFCLAFACLTSRGEDRQKRIDQSEELSEQNAVPIRSFGRKKRIDQSEELDDRLDQSEAVGERSL